MKELITLEQANQLMLAVLVIAPIAGIVWGALTKRIKTGLIWGLVVGIGNIVLWKVYNSITDRLGLDTVKNLLVNLGLFIVIGLIGGFAAGMIARRGRRGDVSPSPPPEA